MTDAELLALAKAAKEENLETWPTAEIMGEEGFSPAMGALMAACSPDVVTALVERARERDCKMDEKAVQDAQGDLYIAERRLATLTTAARAVVNALEPLLDNAEGYDKSNVRAAFLGLTGGTWTREQLLGFESAARFEWKNLRAALDAPPQEGA